jgi:hypothetical protein
MLTGHPGLEVEAAAASGGAAGVLVDESTTARLVVVGTRATGGLRGHLSASVAAQVAAHASCPVVAICGVAGRRCDMSTFEGRPVVVGVVGSASAATAIGFAGRPGRRPERTTARCLGVESVRHP